MQFPCGKNKQQKHTNEKMLKHLESKSHYINNNNNNNKNPHI